MSLSIMGLVITSAAFAQDARLRRLNTGEDGKTWEAVGRLDIAGSGFCTGAMIAPDLVLTAGHCLLDKVTGAPIDPETIEFLAGWRNGRASAYRNVRRAVVHPEYIFEGDVSSTRVRNDLALLQLDRPIRNTTVTPVRDRLPPPQGRQGWRGQLRQGPGRSPFLARSVHRVGPSKRRVGDLLFRGFRSLGRPDLYL